MTQGCIICSGIRGDEALSRTEVWRNDLWRLTLSLDAEVLGFAYLEPIRHIANIAELDGPEAASFGATIAKVSRVLKAATAAEIVYVYIFGDDVAHLHAHLAPHRRGDALNSQMIRGEIVSEKQPNGFERFFSREFPALPEAEQRRIAEIVRRDLAGQ
ncbi:HIT family protein [Taklimakanibacter deserti]|uniref:HIT family protein n=1 Tax=Taklimakanibacter deserti TaxID=2267839 RepID=UPI0013C5146E